MTTKMKNTSQNFQVKIYNFPDFQGQIQAKGAGCGKQNLKNRNLSKILSIFMYDTLCSDMFLYNFETCQNLPLKSTYQGTNFAFFHCILVPQNFLLGIFRPSKIRLIRNLPKNLKILTLPKPQKCPFLDQKNPLCFAFSFSYGQKNHLWQTAAEKRLEEPPRHCQTRCRHRQQATPT